MRALLANAAILAVLLGGCGEEPAQETNRPAEAPTDDVANRLAALPEGQRNAVFIRAIRDAGEDCQHVETSVRAGEYQGNPVWSAQCEGGDSWTIVVTPDGTAQLVNEAEARLVGMNQAAPQNVQER
jgi:hypothetical protein